MVREKSKPNQTNQGALPKPASEGWFIYLFLIKEVPRSLDIAMDELNQHNTTTCFEYMQILASEISEPLRFSRWHI